MKLCFLLFIITVQGIAGQFRKKISVNLPAPNFGGFEADDQHLKVMWHKVDSPIYWEPVIGYIVFIWELPDKTVEKYEIIDGQKQLVKRTEPTKLDPNVFPTDTPTQVVVEGGDKTEAFLKDIKENVQYHIRIRAYTENYRSPLSTAGGVRYVP